LATPLQDEWASLGVQQQGLADGLCSALAGVIVGGGTNAAEGKDHVATVQRVAQVGRDAFGFIAHVAHPVHRHAARCQQLDGFAQVFVLAATTEDLVANDDQSKHVSLLKKPLREQRCGGSEALAGLPPAAIGSAQPTGSG
jgi:hypothetical protein